MFCTLVQVAQRSPASDKVADYLRANNERTDDIGGRRGYLLTSHPIRSGALVCGRAKRRERLIQDAWREI